MIEAEIFKDNAVILIKGRNGMPHYRKLPVSDDIAERYLLNVGKVDRSSKTDTEWADMVKKAKGELSMSKKLLTCPELSAIESLIAATRVQALADYCNPSGIADSWYLIRLDAVDKCNGFVARRVREIADDLVPKLEAVYPGKVEEIRAVWGDKIANALPPVDKLRSLFGMTTLPVQFSVPEGLPPEVRAAEEAKLRETFAKAKETVVAALWEEMKALTDHIVDRLTPAPDGTEKTFQKGTVNNMVAFIEAFQQRNAFNDARLADVVAKAQGILSAVGKNGEIPQRLRDYTAVRTATKEAFDNLKAEVDKGVENVASRLFNFED